MAPNSTIVFIRHAEAMHNIHKNWDLLDPPLSPKGEEQVKTVLTGVFGKEYPLSNKTQLLVISPAVRTLKTALLAFGDEIEKGNFKEVLVVPQFQETADNPCDVCSPKQELKEKYPQFTYELLNGEDYMEKSKGFYSPAQLGERSTWAREWLYKRPEVFIVVVTHSGFLRALMPQDFPMCENRDQYRNCEFRQYRFAEESKNGELGGPFKLSETDWSKEYRTSQRARLDSAGFTGRARDVDMTVP